MDFLGALWGELVGGSVWKLPHNSYANFQLMINVGLRFTYAYTRALNGSYKWNKRIKWQKIINGLEVGVRIPTIRSYKTYKDIVVFVNYTWGTCWGTLRNCHQKDIVPYKPS
ncbi:outer membrane beta-barrel protein [Helicobacter felis]|uniref:outer membrane beta-barrel protein n=2 Tax=Helicobacter felis TaxID=214 RepID=UPI000CF1357C|nr:outer membrane beta-barrel protein [Helicobacter felis]